MPFGTRLNSTRKRLHLTRSEIQALYWVALGFSNQEVAERLCVSKRTIDFHMGNIFRTLEVSNRVQAIRTAQQIGLLDSVALIQSESDEPSRFVEPQREPIR